MDRPDDPPLATHLFICTNRRASGESCAAQGSESLRTAVKQRCKEAGFGDQIRVNASGCLGRCERGITAVFYPQADWHYSLTQDSVEPLVEAAARWIKRAQRS